MIYEQARKIDADARRYFTYQAAPFNLTHWRSFRDDVLAGRPWSGACADLTSTVLDIATHMDFGAPLSECFRLLVSIDGSDKPNHMVGCIRMAGTGFAIVGDTTRPGIYPASDMRHRHFEYNCLAEAGTDPVWRGGVPW